MTNLDKRGLQDDHDPSDIGQRTANRGIMQDERGQQPTDKSRAQQKQQSQMEGPAAHAPHEGEKPTPKYSDM